MSLYISGLCKGCACLNRDHAMCSNDVNTSAIDHGGFYFEDFAIFCVKDKSSVVGLKSEWPKCGLQ